MIPKINSVTTITQQITKNPKASILSTAGTLAVLSTHQVWPHPEPCYSHPKTDDIPKIDLTDSQVDIPDVGDEVTKLHGLPGIIENVSNHIEDGINYIGDKTGDAWDHVKDFFESLGH